MKTLTSLCEQNLSSFQENQEILCHAVMTPIGICHMSKPLNASAYRCTYCNGSKHCCPYVDPSKSHERMWLCLNTLCDVYTKKTNNQATLVLPSHRKCLEWPLFCEINGIGDCHHDVQFENIEQSPAKVDYLRKFGSKPNGIIFMQGPTGTGKTYASMAVCEFFTRKDASCIFTTQKQMFNNWLDTFKSDKVSNYIDRVTTCHLLVVDDFGTAEVSSGFMSFFMDLINTRMQWTNRGTIISTNLDDKKFSQICGDALTDRINTGQKFVFRGSSKRKAKPL